MTDWERQRRLHIQNRLEELNARLGPVEPLEEWGDEYFRDWGQPPADPDPVESPAVEERVVEPVAGFTPTRIEQV